jgi:hypothetical protein
MAQQLGAVCLIMGMHVPQAWEEELSRAIDTYRIGGDRDPTTDRRDPASLRQDREIGVLRTVDHVDDCHVGNRTRLRG